MRFLLRRNDKREGEMSFIGTINFIAMEFISLNEKDIELHNARVRDSSGKPADQWSPDSYRDSIGRGLETNSPALVVTPK
jgi:hypothetical protein